MQLIISMSEFLHHWVALCVSNPDNIWIAIWFKYPEPTTWHNWESIWLDLLIIDGMIPLDFLSLGGQSGGLQKKSRKEKCR